MFKFFNLKKLHPTGDAGAPATNTEGGNGNSDPKPLDNAPDKIDDPDVTLKQSEFDAAIEKRLARAKRQWLKDQQAQTPAKTPPTPPPATGDNDSTAMAQELAAAKAAAEEAKRQAALVTSLALSDKIDKSGAEAALKLADFTSCYDKNGRFDKAEMESVIDEFLEKWPQFVPKGIPTGAPPYTNGGKGRATKTAEKEYLDSKYKNNPFYKG